MLWLYTMIFFISAGTLFWMFWEPRQLRIEETQLKLNDLPASLKDYRIVFISDLHVGPFMNLKRMRRMVDVIRGLKPDLLILGGDYVGDNLSPRKLYSYTGELLEMLLLLPPEIAKVAVLGNHDFWTGSQLLLDAFEEANIQLLDNRAFEIPGQPQLLVVGTADLWEEMVEIPDLEEYNHKIKILVSHNPDVFADILPTFSPGTFQLAVAGHTHGGQLTLFRKFAPFLPSSHGGRYLGRHHHEEETPIIVSNGLGAAVPLRIGAIPELNLIILKDAK